MFKAKIPQLTTNTVVQKKDRYEISSKIGVFLTLFTIKALSCIFFLPNLGINAVKFHS